MYFLTCSLQEKMKYQHVVLFQLLLIFFISGQIAFPLFEERESLDGELCNLAHFYWLTATCCKVSYLSVVRRYKLEDFWIYSDQKLYVENSLFILYGVFFLFSSFFFFLLPLKIFNVIGFIFDGACCLCWVSFVCFFYMFLKFVHSIIIIIRFCILLLSFFYVGNWQINMAIINNTFSSVHQ